MYLLHKMLYKTIIILIAAEFKKQFKWTMYLFRRGHWTRSSGHRQRANRLLSWLLDWPCYSDYCLVNRWLGLLSSAYFMGNNPQYTWRRDQAQKPIGHSCQNLYTSCAQLPLFVLNAILYLLFTNTYFILQILRKLRASTCNKLKYI